MASNYIDENNNSLHFIPVTCHDVSECTKDISNPSVYRSRHLVLSDVIIIALLRSKEIVVSQGDPTDSFMTLMVNDWTTPSDIKAIHFFQNQEDVDIELSVYVKIFGRIADLPDGSKAIKVFNIQKIKEMNQITHHMLACINASISYLTPESSQATNERINYKKHLVKLNDLENKLYDMIKESMTNGVTKAYMCNNFENSAEEISDALQSLIDHGMIHSYDSGTTYYERRN